MDHRRAWLRPEALPEGEAEGRHLRLDERVAHYIRDVLRMAPGDALELFDGRGRVLDCRIQRVSDDGVRVAVLEDREVRRNESPCDLTVCAAIPKGKRWRWILEKCTELGVRRIVPLHTHHGVVEVPDERLERKLERWRRIVGEAARQCERTLTPEIHEPRRVERFEPSSHDGRDLLLHARRGSQPLAETVDEGIEDTPIRLWIGPEGGFADDEVARLREAGARLAHLGPRILRAETAAVVATTVVQTALGDLSAPGAATRTDEDVSKETA